MQRHPRTSISTRSSPPKGGSSLRQKTEDKRQKTEDRSPLHRPRVKIHPNPPRRPETYVDDIIGQRYSITSLFTRSFFALFARFFARFFNVFACALGRLKCARFRTIRIFLTPSPSKDTPTRRFLGVHFSHFSQGPARVREQSASLNAHRPDSNPTLFSQFSPRPAPVREQSASLNAHRPDSNPTLFAKTETSERRFLRVHLPRRGGLV